VTRSLRPMCAIGVIAGVLLAGVIGTARAQRLELRPVETVTLATQQFLTDGTNGKPATIAGELRIPKPGTDRLPAVILITGAGGITPVTVRWAETINSIGMATFVLDSFSGRGITEVSKLDAITPIVDSYRALGVLAAHPRIDPGRIAVMGNSFGARGALYSSNVRFRDMYSPQGIEFAAHIALYAPCNTAYRDDDKVTGKPIRMFHGVADDLFSIEPCRAYVARLKQHGADIELTEFPGAHHAYDGFTIEGVEKHPQARSSRNCHLAEGDNGQILNHMTGQPFDFASDPCVEKGLTFAYDEPATTATVAAVKAFLAATLK
jgi:dienelactone hydrolase